jgi:hypothetical protein
MANAEFSKDAKTVPKLDDMIQRVDSTPGAIGFIGLESKLPAHIILPVTSPIGRPVTLITVGRPNASVEALVNYIRAKGQIL